MDQSFIHDARTCGKVTFGREPVPLIIPQWRAFQLRGRAWSAPRPTALLDWALRALFAPAVVRAISDDAAPLRAPQQSSSSDGKRKLAYHSVVDEHRSHQEVASHESDQSLGGQWRANGATGIHFDA